MDSTVLKALFKFQDSLGGLWEYLINQQVVDIVYNYAWEGMIRWSSFNIESTHLK
jgi:hypothetical protein